MKTDRDDRSFISIVGSYALRGRCWEVLSEEPLMPMEEGWRRRRSGVEL